jgi:AcrR family transcriptional regulator
MVEQALADVRQQGVDRVSLRHIAQALDVSPSAAYNHFADKESFLAAGRGGLRDRRPR